MANILEGYVCEKYSFYLEKLNLHMCVFECLQSVFDHFHSDGMKDYV